MLSKENEYIGILVLRYIKEYSLEPDQRKRNALLRQSDY